LWELVQRYPELNIKEAGFGEGGFIIDADGQRLHMAQGITEEYGSAVARMFDLLNRGECSYYANWEYLTDRSNYNIDINHKPYLKTPSANVAECAFKLYGCNKLKPLIDGNSNEGNIVGSIAGYDKKKKHLRVLMYNHNSKIGDYGTEKVCLLLKNIQSPSESVIKTRQWRIDNEHSNFSSIWLKESEDFTRNTIEFDMGTRGNSCYDTPIHLYLNEAGKKYYYSRKEYYKLADALDEMEPEPGWNRKIAGGEFSLEVRMPQHSVLLLELENVTLQDL